MKDCGGRPAHGMPRQYAYGNYQNHPPKLRTGFLAGLETPYETAACSPARLWRGEPALPLPQDSLDVLGRAGSPNTPSWIDDC